MTTIDELRREGIVRLDRRLAPEEIARIHGHLRGCKVYNAHMAAQALQPPCPLPAALKAKQWPMFSHAMHDVVRAPVVLPLAIELTALAAEYFEEPALLFSLNAYWTQPAPGKPYGQTHGWHRDGDDRKFLALMIYGTDVPTADAGAHGYLQGTHSLHGDSEVPAEWKTLERTILGPAGTLFLTNGRSFHKGHRPALAPRLMLWARWCVSDPPAAYRWDKLSPLPATELAPGVYPDDEATRKAIRLVVN